MNNFLIEKLHIKHPVIMAPLFLVSNVAMVIAACESGITGVIPALNYRTDKELRTALEELNAMNKTYGINLIVNRSNLYLKEQLDSCLEYQVPFIITSLGNPKQVIEEFHKIGSLVFCDVSDLDYARKAASYGPDALIAVTNLAGGHTGKYSPEVFIPALVKEFPQMPIITAGGVSNSADIQHMLDLGACGVSVGTIFIASEESPVSQDYKEACVNYGAEDIVITTKLSGVPCTVINTDYVKKLGNHQNLLEVLLNKNRTLKKWFKLFVYKRGMDKLKKAAFSATYQNVWCAGKTIEYVKEILPVKKIVENLLRKL
ncbi:MAG: nitronate monooxygenase [Bacteroidota bacterium]|nr:nitronate monooxygenase [Bacteroidota bacterium]